MTSHTARTRRTLLWVGIPITIVALIAVTLVMLLWPRPAESTVIGEVGENGFELELADGVRVSAGSGVATKGTPVTVELVKPQISGDFASFASPLGSGVDVVLGDGLQPAIPITIEYSFTDKQLASVRTDRLFVLGEGEDAGQAVEFAESTWDPTTMTLTATVEHLSWYTPAEVDDDTLGEKFGEWMDIAAGIRSEKPDCVDEPADPSGAFVLADPRPASAWVCADTTADGVTVTLQSNSGLVFEIFTSPNGEFGRPTALSLEEVLTTYAAELMESGDGVLLAGGSTEISFEDPFTFATIAIRVSPGLTQLSTIAWGTQMLLPEKWAAALDWYECGTAVLQSPLNGGAVNARTVFDCFGSAVGGTAGALLGILAEGPGQLVTQIEGLVREINRTNVEEFTVYLVAADAIRHLPDGASWLFEHTADGDNTAGDEDTATLLDAEGHSATYPFSTNQWVSCTRTASEARYDLGGEWSTLSYIPAVQAHAPAGLTAQFEILGDGILLEAIPVTNGSVSERTELDVSGVRELTVRARTDDACGGAKKGYATLVQAYLR